LAVNRYDNDSSIGKSLGIKTRNTIPKSYPELDPHIHKSTIPNNKLPPDAIVVDSPNILFAPLEAAVVDEALEEDTVEAVELGVEVEAPDEASDGVPVLAPPDAAPDEPTDVAPGEPADVVPGEPDGATLGKPTEPVNPEAVSNGTDTPPASHTEANCSRMFCPCAIFVWLFGSTASRQFTHVLRDTSFDDVQTHCAVVQSLRVS